MSSFAGKRDTVPGRQEPSRGKAARPSGAQSLQAKLSRVIEAEVVTRFWCPATITPNEVRAWIRQPHPEPAKAGLISGMKVLRVDVVVDDDLAVFGWTCRNIGDVPDHPA